MDKKAFGIGLGIGLAVGIITALFTTPTSGKANRRFIRIKAVNIKNKLTKHS